MQHKVACLFGSTIHCAGAALRQGRLRMPKALRREEAESDDCVCDGTNESREIAIPPARRTSRRLLDGGALRLVTRIHSRSHCRSIYSHGATSASNRVVIGSIRQ